MIPSLPNWFINSKNPSFYDTESATTIEMVAKLHASVNNIIKLINEEHGESKDKAFEIALRQEFQDFMDVVELSVGSITLLTERVETLENVVGGIVRDISRLIGGE